MKTSKTQQASPLPSYQEKPIQFLSPQEMAVFHHFSFTKSDRKSSQAFNLTPEEFQQLLKSATDKMHIFFERFKIIKEEVRLSIYPPKGKNRLIEILGLSTVFAIICSAQKYILSDNFPRSQSMTYIASEA
jgi:hypothetical protein